MPLPLRCWSLCTLEARLNPAVFTSFDSVTGLMVVRSDGADAITIKASATAVLVNGKPQAFAAADVQRLQVLGGIGKNKINLAGVQPVRFTALTHVFVDAGPGRDVVTGSPFADNILGGADRDILRGRDGNDTLRGGGDADVLDGGNGNDLLLSSDPVEAGFNDAIGINANATLNAPYTVGGNLLGGGGGEIGWDTGWQHPGGSPTLAKVQNAIVYEGDGALHVSGGTAELQRSLSTPVASGTVRVSHMVYVPAGGNVTVYVRDGAMDKVVGTAAQWTANAGQTLKVIDLGDVLVDTGIAVPVQQWFRIETAINFDSKTWEFFVNGVKFTSPTPLDFRGNPGAISTVTYLVESAPGIYLDALQIDNATLTTATNVGDKLLGGNGDDTLRGGSTADKLYGGHGNDSLSGGAGNDTLHGQSGDDQLEGDTGHDLLLGSVGHDTLAGNAGNDTLDGGVGNDFLTGNADNDRLRDNRGNDTLFGSAGNDFLTAGLDDDTLNGGGGADRLDGGAGNDTVESGDPAPPPPSPGIRSGFNDATGVNADGIDNSPFNVNSGDTEGSGVGEPGWNGPWDRAHGGATTNRIQNTVTFEGDGAAYVYGGTQGLSRRWLNPDATGVVVQSQMIYAPVGGQMQLYLLDGDMVGGPETTTAVQWRVDAGNTFRVLDGSTFEDTGIVLPANTWTHVAVHVDMDARTYAFYVNDTLFNAPDPLNFRGNPGALSSLAYLIEDVDGVYIDDVRVVQPAPAPTTSPHGDTLLGGTGNDTITGADGTDLLLGGTGNDVVTGGAGRDLLIGGKGADNLTGGDGEDLLIGGTTSYDRHSLALPSILNEWASDRSATARFSNITVPSTATRLNGNYFLKLGRVKIDQLRDTLSGGADTDGFFTRQSEDDSDLQVGEFLLPL